jgi:hypothetical protein
LRKQEGEVLSGDDDRRAWIVGRAEGREDLCVKAPAARPAGQFDDEKIPLGLPGVGVDEKMPPRA